MPAIVDSNHLKGTSTSDRPKESPNQVLLAMLAGYQTTQALYVVAKLGLADLLQHGPMNSEGLARKVGANPRALFRVMRHLAALGILTQDNSGRFGLTALGEVLRTDDHQSVRYFAILEGETLYRAAGELLHTVRTGETAFNHLYGKGHFEYLAENPEASSIFNKAMAQTLALKRLENPVESYDYIGKHLAVDVGGGRGDLIASILRGNPGMRGILFDLPQGIGEAEQLLKDRGVASRCRVIAGSFFDSIPAGGDVYIMSRVLHDFPDEKAAIILANCRKSIAEGGTLLVRENVLPEQGASPMATKADLTMLFMLGGAERTEPEWKTLLDSAGFAVTRVLKGEGQLDLIEAKPIRAH